MKRLIEQVRDFHRAAGHPVYDGTTPSMQVRSLRDDMLAEEVRECSDAWVVGDRIEIVDGAGDTLYLLAGDCVVFGWHCALPIRLGVSAPSMPIEQAHDQYRKYGRAYLDNLALAAIKEIEAAGYDPRKVVDEISASNMSKLVKDERDEIDTARAYDAIGVLVEFRGEYPEWAAISAGDQVGADGKRYPQGKVLKSIHWREPDFSGCLA